MVIKQQLKFHQLHRRLLHWINEARLKQRFLTAPEKNILLETVLHIHISKDKNHCQYNAGCTNISMIAQGLHIQLETHNVP